MKILITGATGFVGRALVAKLLNQGHQVIAAVRNPTRARGQLGAEPAIIDIKSDGALNEAVSESNAIVNLAGEGLFVGRWNKNRKASLRKSRIEVTSRLVASMQAANKLPKVFISTSAIGIYGDTADEEITERSTLGDDFLAQLCHDWESEAERVTKLGVRLVTLRIGVVMGLGGALQKILPPFTLGFGGRLGTGRQWFSWIHIDDLVGLILTAVNNDGWSGVYNATAPIPVTNEQLTEALSKVVGKRAFFPVPSLALRMLMGEAAEVLLGGQKVLPRRALTDRFVFKYNSIKDALRQILSPRGVKIQRCGSDWQLTQETRLPQSRQNVFSFFSSPANLGLLTPPWMGFEFLEKSLACPQEGTQYNYRVRLGPIAMGWRSLIQSWVDNQKFVDVQLKGPYAKWHHEHRFVEDGDYVRMTDTVLYRVPFGVLGRISHSAFVAPVLRSIFRYRAEAIQRRFGEDPSVRRVKMDRAS